MIAWQALVIFVGVFGAALGLARWIVAVEKRPDVGEAWLKKYLRLDTQRPMSGLAYGLCLLAVSALVGAWVYIVGSLQACWPMNPTHLPNLKVQQAALTAVATLTHTNWQPWAPEGLLSGFTLRWAVLPGNLMIGAVCVAAWRALVNALARRPLGNAWAGVWRGLVILVPLQLLLTLILITQGVPENWTTTHVQDAPVASFVAGSMITGAGSGWLGNSWASKLQNPTLWSDLAGLIALIGLPLAFCYATGRLINRERLLERMALGVALLLALAAAVSFATTSTPSSPQRWALSEALWLNATAGSANGTLNAPVEHFAPSGRLGAFLILLSGLPVPPAIGLGVGIMLMYLFVAVYLANLMVGRSPSFMGFKVGWPEVLAVAAGVLGPQLVVLAGMGLFTWPQVSQLIAQQGPAGMSALLWMIGSTAQNNGSAFALPLTQPVLINAGMLLMLLGRLFTLAAVVGLAARLALQRNEAPALPALEEKSPLMMGFWLCVMVVGAALTVLPVIFLGPLLEVLR